MMYETQFDSLQHFGIKGQKWGLRRFQEEDGSLTDVGRARYGVGKETSGQENDKKAGPAKQKNRDRAKKIVAAVAATSLAAVTAYAVAKKTTKMRDDYRAKAKDKASDNFWANLQASRIHLHAIDEVMLDRKDPKRKDTPDWLKTSHIHEARRSAILRDATKREYEKNKKISETATRRDAVKNYVSEKRKQRANEKAYRKNSIEVRLKNTSRR